LRILHLIDRVDAVGGVQTYLSALVPLLAGAGVDSVVAAGSPGTIGGAVAHEVPELAVDGARLSAVAAASLDRLLVDTRPDLVLSHLAEPGAVVVAARRAPVVVYPHDYAAVCPGNARYLHRSRSFCEEGPGLRCFWRAYSERTTNRRPDRLLRAYARVRAWRAVWPLVPRVVVASEFVRDLLVADGVEPARVDVVAYPIEPGPAREAGDPVDVVSIGRLVASKGVAVLLRALAELRDATAVVAGDGPERAQLEASLEGLGLTGRVSFVGWVDGDARDRLLRSARVFALPSLWDEPFGIAGVEALALGTPVVATRVGGIPSWLRDGEGGMLVERADAGGLAAALRRILGDSAFAASLTAATPAAAERFSSERHLLRLLPALRSVL
jgi:glycosyltransferase involved in cell wall biosynthesis